MKCNVCGDDVQHAGGKPIRAVTLPAEVAERVFAAPNPRAALALWREARAQEVKPSTEHVLCRRCAQTAGLSGT
jgi:hypothetical protein